MSLNRGRYGLEWSERPEDDSPSGLGRILAFVSVLVAISLVITVISRLRSDPEEEGQPEEPREEASETGKPRAVAPLVEPPVDSAAVPAVKISSVKRPPKVKNLIARREFAEAQGNLELEVSTIEQIRGLPGEPAADIDDQLARRLGALNTRWLFEKRNAQWVCEVPVKKGDFATRIAQEHGSTLSSMVRLNGWQNADRLMPGKNIFVMDHPRFSLKVMRRARTADLYLNGKFFKRYDLTEEVIGENGAFETDGRTRQNLSAHGIALSPADRAELELLLPRKTPLLISDL